MSNTFSGFVRLGCDAELSISNKGHKVLNFNALNTVGKKDSECKMWLSISYWRGDADKICHRLRKGMIIFVTGELLVSTDDRNGRFNMDLNAMKIDFIPD